MITTKTRKAPSTMARINAPGVNRGRPSKPTIKQSGTCIFGRSLPRSSTGTGTDSEAVGLLLDYSKNRITDQTVELLLQLAEESGLRERIEGNVPGENINVTEQRAVLHVALRAPRSPIMVDGENVVRRCTRCLIR